MYQIIFSKHAAKHRALLKQAGLEAKARALLALLSDNPFQAPPPYEKLVGDLKNAFSRRLNRQHRLVYMVDEQQKIVKILSMWTHYQ